MGLKGIAAVASSVPSPGHGSRVNGSAAAVDTFLEGEVAAAARVFEGWLSPEDLELLRSVLRDALLTEPVARELVSRLRGVHGSVRP